MRQQARSLVRYIVLALALVVAASTHASADDRSEARTHYQAGVKFYSGGDYKTAIREFSAAQQLAPADLNNYNLALCYDKLGDAEPAVQYYRAYLDKVPNTDKRTEIEASISRLDTAAKSVASKKAEEARKAEAAQKAAADAKAASDARIAEELRKSEAAKAAAEASRRPPTPGPAVPGPAVPGPSDDRIIDPGTGTGLGSTGTPGTGTPGTGTPATTGDAQLDRVSQIDINAIRDQRRGGAASGMADNRGGPAASGPAVAATAGGAASAEAAPNAGTPNAAAAGPSGVPASDQPKKADPVYKKWWFWAVVAVSAYVVYSIATDNSSNPQPVRARELPLPMSTNAAAGGYTLMRW
jgi:hypothetical protein